MNEDTTNNIKRLLVVAATNRPEELDDAARRRLSKQLYVPLPCALARRSLILKTLTNDHVSYQLEDRELDVLVEKTQGYSGADMSLMIKVSGDTDLIVNELRIPLVSLSQCCGEEEEGAHVLLLMCQPITP